MAAPREGNDAESRGVISWRCVPFGELTPRELHDILQARAAVFVVEQKCAFQDVDGVDPESWHVMGFSPSPLGEGRGEGSSLIAYARLVPPGIKFAEPSIGRVITASENRGEGHGRALMQESLRHAERLWPGAALRIGAQRYLERFYGEFGFATVSEPYDEDGILHVEMVRPASTIPDRSGQPAGR